MEALTPDEIRDKLRESLMEAAVAILVEAAVLRLADRLKHHQRKPSRRFVRRALGAILSELAAEGIAMSYAQRRRARWAIDDRLAREQRATQTVTLPPGAVPVPAQRTSHEGRPVTSARTTAS